MGEAHTSLVDRVARFIAEHRLIGPRARVLVAVSGAIAMWKAATRWADRRRALRQLRRRLHSLTFREREVLKRYIRSIGDTRTAEFQMPNGEVLALEQAAVLYQATTQPVEVDRLAPFETRYLWLYNINDWAFEYLTKHRELLDK